MRPGTFGRPASLCNCLVSLCKLGVALEGQQPAKSRGMACFSGLATQHPCMVQVLRARKAKKGQAVMKQMVGSARGNLLFGVLLLWILGGCGAGPDGGAEADAVRVSRNAVAGAANRGVMAQQSLPSGSRTSSNGTVGATSVAGSPFGNNASLDDIASVAVPSAKFTQVPYVTKLYDNWNQFDLASHRFTSTYGADYRVCAAATSSNCVFELDLAIDGARERAMAISRRGVGQGCRNVSLAAGHSVEVQTWQTQGNPASFEPNNAWNWLTIDRIWPTVSLGGISTFAVPSAQFTAIPYADKTYDRYDEFDVATGRYTAAFGGARRFCIAATSFVPDFEVDLFINGSRENAIAVSNYGAALGCRTVRLVAGQYVEARVHQTVAASMTFAANAIWNWMTVDWPVELISLDNTPAFSVPSGSSAKVPYNSVIYDDYGYFDLQNSRFGAAFDGKYSVCASLASFTSDFDLQLYVNGAPENGIARSLYGAGQGCRTVALRAGDYLEVWVYQGTGATVNFQPNHYWNWLTVDKADNSVD